MRQAAIEDHALLSDCRGVALVTSDATIDWWCVPRVDDASVFGLLVDEDGGCCTIAPAEQAAPPRRRYLPGTLVVETTLTDRDGVARVLDCLVVAPHDLRDPPGQLLRVIERVDGEPRLRVRVTPRFDYGIATPWIRRAPGSGWHAFAGDDGLHIAGDIRLERASDGVLAADLTLRERRARLSMRFVRPEVLDREPPPPPPREALDAALAMTTAYWSTWSEQVRLPERDADGILRSALTLRALTTIATGAMIAAATTSLPESAEGRTWDYRASWIRDSTFAVRSLAALGLPGEAEAFRRFVQRSAAGHAHELRIAYGPGGERRMPEIELEQLRGWRGIGPVRVGNGALGQRQSDALGDALELTWRWHERGGRPDDDQWRFLCGLVDRAAEEWAEPDRGLWEWRGEPRHFVHSKALCWVALDRGVRLAEALGRDAPLERWRAERDSCRASILEHGVRGGVLVQAYGHDGLDAAVLRLPVVGLLPYDDPLMVTTVDAVLDRLGDRGLVRRYEADDGLPGREGAFLPCTFWAVQVLAGQGRHDEASQLLERALATRNDLGLFPEEFDPGAGVARGNFPQALTHLAHIDAVLALDAVREPTAAS